MKVVMFVALLGATQALNLQATPSAERAPVTAAAETAALALTEADAQIA